ncbi:MAG: class I SAM-dependent RNA methyltransferase [Candidatus Electrothrix communis]|nr:MAG: class I SAM-dependent RNA methyltransferase [Candidatus Electrothrix communis]
MKHTVTKHTVTIEKIIPGGKGLARTADGQVVMIPFTLPNESVLVKEDTKKSGYIEGELDRVLSPSAARIEPPCSLYGECGGCDLQHGNYQEQLNIKKGIVEESLHRAKVPLEHVQKHVQDTVASPLQWGYRYRLRLKINPAGQLGFFKKRSNEFLPVSHCPVAAQGINSALAELSDSRILQSLAGTCPEIELLESPADGKITLVLRGEKHKTPPSTTLQALATSPYINHVGWTSRKGFQYLSPQADPLSQHVRFGEKSCTLSWSGGCFSQVNPGQNEQLIRLVCELAGALSGDLSGKTVLDLYCGMGNFSIPLGLCGGTVTGIEGNRESIHWAEKNGGHAKIKAHFFTADVRETLKQLSKQGEQADIILLDPPRSGVGKNITLLSRLEPEKIIYVSCDPATLARDLNLLRPHGYMITRVVPVDMFPQTSHVESVVLLERG